MRSKSKHISIRCRLSSIHFTVLSKKKRVRAKLWTSQAEQSVQPAWNLTKRKQETGGRGRRGEGVGVRGGGWGSPNDLRPCDETAVRNVGTLCHEWSAKNKKNPKQTTTTNKKGKRCRNTYTHRSQEQAKWHRDLHRLLSHLGPVSWRPTTVKWRQFSQSNRYSTIDTRQTEYMYHETLPLSANDDLRWDCTFADDGNASWYWVCRVPMVCENCRHLTVHDTGPKDQRERRLTGKQGGRTVH